MLASREAWVLLGRTASKIPLPELLEPHLNIRVPFVELVSRSFYGKDKNCRCAFKDLNSFIPPHQPFKSFPLWQHSVSEIQPFNWSMRDRLYSWTGGAASLPFVTKRFTFEWRWEESFKERLVGGRRYTCQHPILKSRSSTSLVSAVHKTTLILPRS